MKNESEDRDAIRNHLLFCEMDYHAGNRCTGVVWLVVNGKWEKKIDAERASHE